MELTFPDLKSGDLQPGAVAPAYLPEINSSAILVEGKCLNIREEEAMERKSVVTLMLGGCLMAPFGVSAKSLSDASP